MIDLLLICIHYCCVARVQMNIQMMKMPVGKFEEQQLNAWQL